MPKIETSEPIKMPPDSMILRSIPEDAVCIWSGEHDAWWRDNVSGYTKYSGNAGVYTKEEAYKITKHCGPEKQLSISPHPYAGCTFYHQYSEGSIPKEFEQTLESDGGCYQIRLTYELHGEGMFIIKGVEVKEK